MYLTAQQQQCLKNGCLSSQSNLLCGVLQGSILGPCPFPYLHKWFTKLFKGHVNPKKLFWGPHSRLVHTWDVPNLWIFCSLKPVFTLKNRFKVLNFGHLELRNLANDVTSGPLVTWSQMSLLNTLWNKRMFTWFLFEKSHIFIMVKRCVIQFCSNLNKTGHTMHKFPKDANLRWQWVKFVQVKRANFVELIELSVICNIHFSLDCYEKSFLVEMGLRK